MGVSDGDARGLAAELILSALNWKNKGFCCLGPPGAGGDARSDHDHNPGWASDRPCVQCLLCIQWSIKSIRTVTSTLDPNSVRLVRVVWCEFVVPDFPQKPEP